MSRYIDADKLYGSMQWNIQHDMYDKPFDYLAEIDCQPTADVVEVVRCKDCKYNESGACANSGFLLVGPNDYCSYAEKI